MSVQIPTVSSFDDLENFDFDTIGTDCNCPACIMNNDAAIEHEFEEAMRFSITDLLGNLGRLQWAEMQFREDELAREEEEAQHEMDDKQANRESLLHSHPKREGSRKAADMTVAYCDLTSTYRARADWRRKQNGTRSSEWKREQNRSGRGLRRKFAAQEAQDWHESMLDCLRELEEFLAEEWQEYVGSEEEEDEIAAAEYEERRADYWKYDCSSWRLNEYLYWAGKPTLDNDDEDAITVTDYEGNFIRMHR
jgi:hypothetical protein